MNKSWSIWGNSIKNNAKQIFECFDEKPVVLCLGTNKLLSDCLGPMVGSMLKKYHYDGYVYGTLDAPVSAINLKACLNFLKATHKNSKILIVDASTTSNPSRIGKIVLANSYLPFNKALYDLNVCADYFLFGVCCRHSPQFKSLYNAKLEIIEKISKTICFALLGNQKFKSF